MGLPVVTVASGGLPIVESTVGGTPVTEATNGRGMPVTKVVGKPGLPVVFETIGVGPSVPVLTTFATFDGVNTLVSLSNGNRTVTHNNTSTNAGAISTIALSAGKYYFELAIQTSSGPVYNGIGAISSAWSGTFSSTQGATNLTGVNPAVSSLIYSNGASTGLNLGSVAVADIFCFALDLTARLAWVRRNSGNWNNSGAADPAAGIGGVAVTPTIAFRPYVSFAGSTVSTDTVTGNFGQSVFAFSKPSGFISGWGT